MKLPTVEENRFQKVDLENKNFEKKNLCPNQRQRHKGGKGPKTQKVYVPAKQIHR